MINIADILKDCPKGTKLYSPICGNCKLLKIYNGLGFDVINDTDEVFNFSYDGRYNLNGECCIFPSKENRDWNKFRPFKDGDIISNYECIAIFHKFGKPKSCEYDKVVYYHCWCHQNGKVFKFEKDFGIGRDTDYKFATDEEKQKLFDVIKENGYKWNPETKTLEKMIVTEFKDGDILTYTSNYTTTFIYRNKDNEPHFTTSFYVGCNDAPTHNFLIYNKYTLIALNENCDVRLATEDEKIKLFDAIKANGYKWNAETKTLEKLIVPKFKVGDEIVKKNGITNSYIVNGVSSDYYALVLPNRTDIAVLNVYEQDDWELVSIIPKFKVGDRIKLNNSRFIYTITDLLKDRYRATTDSCDLYEIEFERQDAYELVPNHKFKVGDKIRNRCGGAIYRVIGIVEKGYEIDCFSFIQFSSEDSYELVPNKFDITTLKPFESKVLVRDVDHNVWEAAIFGRYDGEKVFVVGGIDWNQCIPYEGNEQLLGTNNDCDEYYKNW